MDAVKQRTTKVPKTIAGENNQLLNPYTILEGLEVGDGKVVADLGCGGVGFFVFPASHLVGDKGLVYSVDILKPNLDSITSKMKAEGIYNIRTVWSNLEIYGGTAIPAHSIDVALLINVLFQSTKHKEVLKEAHRLIKKGGTLAIIDWKSKAMPFGPASGNKLSKDKIKQIAVLAGFQFDEEFEAGEYHYGLQFKKL